MELINISFYSEDYNINRFFRDIEKALRSLENNRKNGELAVTNNIPLDEKSITHRDNKIYVTIDLGCIDEEITAGVNGDILILKIDGLSFDLKLPVKGSTIDYVNVNNGIVDIRLEVLEDECEEEATEAH